jgi:hypothetical protein
MQQRSDSGSSRRQLLPPRAHPVPPLGLGLIEGQVGRLDEPVGGRAEGGEDGGGADAGGEAAERGSGVGDRQRLDAGAETLGHLTASVGAAAILPTVDATPDGLIEAADLALAQAKAEGRNRVCAGREELAS